MGIPGIVKGESDPPPQSGWVVLLKWTAGAFAVLFVLAIIAGGFRSQTPEGKQRAAERMMIEYYCELQDDELQELSVRRHAREQCQYLRGEYDRKWRGG